MPNTIEPRAIFVYGQKVATRARVELFLAPAAATLGGSFPSRVGTLSTCPFRGNDKAWRFNLQAIFLRSWRVGPERAGELGLRAVVDSTEAPARFDKCFTMVALDL